jgi:CshA-type fibril repeat protein
VLEPPPRPPRARGTRLPARAAALLASAAHAASLALPAAALGEDGTFEFPAQTQTLEMIPGAVTRIPLLALIADDVEDEVDLDSARLDVPQDLAADLRSRMEPGEDSLSIAVAGEGTWTLLGTELVFTPLDGIDGPSTPIALTIGGDGGSRSLPVVLTPELLDLEELEVHGSAGETTSVQLPADLPADGTVRLELTGLPAGSTVGLDGSRATVAEQGTWQLSSDRRTLTHTPAGPDLGRQLNPIHYVVENADGVVERAGRVTLTIPIISDLDRSAPFGEDIVFVVGEGQQNVDPTTLRLEPVGDQGAYEASADGTRVIEQGVGVWTLDRTAATVRFAPESAEVREVAPMGITGGDGEGASAATALLSTAYPILVPRAQAAPPGAEIVFDLSTGIRDVRSESLRFGTAAVPEGATVSADGSELVVPGEGTWRIDLESRSVVMTPEADFTGSASPVTVEARGVYADNPVEATMQAIFSPVIATLRDDEARTAPGSPVPVDVLGNDTAGSGSQPLEPGSVEISSLSATNVSELEGGRGKRLVIPGEGVFTVGGNGTVTFAPEEGFAGRTSTIVYHVVDSAGSPAHASLAVDVDPGLGAGAEQGPEITGINSLLAGLMPSSPSTALVFGTIVMLLLFGGAVSLWTGTRIEADRRDWED